MAPKPDTEIADSWDDEPLDEDAPQSKAQSQAGRVQGSEKTHTPQWDEPDIYTYTPGGGQTGSASAQDTKRPEKSTAVASRLIAAGLGVRAPRRTEEQRQYERAMREQERRRKEAAADEARRQAEDKEKAKAAVWGD